MSTITQLLQAANAQGLQRLDAQLLMLHACGQSSQDRAWLITHDRDVLPAAQLERWQTSLQRRLQGEPVAYIIGHKEFYGLRLAVDARVLDPRDDTETLVDWALQLILSDKPCQVLDLGTGSGAIALAIQSQRPLVQMTATDASPDALQVARSNAQTHGLPVRFVQADARQSDWFATLPAEKFDLIVSNPPYIAEGDAHLAALTHEPDMALTSGPDGLDAIRSIISHAAAHLQPQGWLLLEHGFDQAASVCALLTQAGFTQVASHADLSGHLRCSGAQLPSG